MAGELPKVCASKSALPSDTRTQQAVASATAFFHSGQIKTETGARVDYIHAPASVT